MTDHIPEVYTDLRGAHPEIAEALDRLGELTSATGPLDDRTVRLVKLGIAAGAQADGAVRSHARRALADGISPDELRQVALLTITTRGFPAAVAAWGWIDEVIAAEGG
ncbi:MAG: carboxymuconolactone decarboxylase family protein [Acidimicrobiales bacterium]|nr:carboxymuconolactone decarboxylase family protein [Acidimicrobiales bacterium]